MNERNKKPIVWNGETKCDICGNECGDILYDGVTKLGPWATMCEGCMTKYGYGCGIGIGQMYERNPNTFQYEQVNRR